MGVPLVTTDVIPMGRSWPDCELDKGLLVPLDGREDFFGLEPFLGRELRVGRAAAEEDGDRAAREGGVVVGLGHARMGKDDGLDEGLLREV